MVPSDAVRMIGKSHEPSDSNDELESPIERPPESDALREPGMLPARVLAW